MDVTPGVLSSVHAKVWRELRPDGISTPENALQPPFYPFRVVRDLDMRLPGWQWIGH